MPINKVSVVNAGVYTNPNTFSRSLSKAYENLGTQINFMADAFAVGQRATVIDGTDTRWSWNVETGMFGTSINSSVTGLDGTSIYTYAGTDYLSIDPIFLSYNPDNITQVRPATIYESFQKTKAYVDTAITERTSAILDIANSLDIDLTGASDGTIVISVSESAAPSPWKVITDYGATLDYGIVGPGGNKLLENVGHIGLEAAAVKFDTNYLDISACDTVPTGALADRGRIYYSSADSSLHLLDHDGNDTALGVGGGGTETLTIDLHVGGPTSVEALQFSDNSLKSVITGPTPDSGVAAKSLIIQGQSQTGAAGGEINIWGGDSTTDAGDINIGGGNNEGSDPFAYAGNVYLKGGASTAGAGGFVDISGGTGTYAGEVKVRSNSYLWTFTRDGNISIPNSKDILDASGNSVISGGNRVKNYNSSSGASVPVDSNNIYSINTGTNATTITLPATADIPIGYEIIVLDNSGNASTNNITITAALGSSIISAPSGIAIDTDYGLIAFKYIGLTKWAILYGR